ncbi:DUF4373 domain-containing protein [Candidatus Pacearchaeota archaeon]|nr:DUF4373 domain-containing protein [Candidatus Pacearchaeota archaeon]
MPRPNKTGLDYFSHDVYMSEDPKLEMIEADFRIEGYGVYVKILERIYRNGYYIQWDGRQLKLFSRRVNVDINLVTKIVTACINEGLFDLNAYKCHKILTSTGIQRRFIAGTMRRNEVEMFAKYLLLEKSEVVKSNKKIRIINDSMVNVDINHSSTAINDDISTQSKVKERKVKESKGKKESLLEGLKEGMIQTWQYLQEFPEPDLEKNAIEVIKHLRITKNPNSTLPPDKNEIEQIIKHWLLFDDLPKENLIKLIDGAGSKEFEKDNLQVSYILKPEHRAKLLQLEESMQKTGSERVPVEGEDELILPEGYDNIKI